MSKPLKGGDVHVIQEMQQDEDNITDSSLAVNQAPPRAESKRMSIHHKRHTNDITSMDRTSKN